MRVPILSACCAALTLTALPAAAHGWSSSEADRGDTMQRNCPIVQPAHPVAYRHGVHAGVRHHARAGAGCPVARAEPGHYRYQRVFTRDEHDWSHEDQGSWRRDRQAWSDGNWSGRGGPGCHDANGPGAYRDGDGAHRAAPDRGMRCHDQAMRRDDGYARSGFAVGYSREEDSQWSSSEHRGGWAEDRGSGRPSMTDRYGFLTWPGKTHFMHGQPIGDDGGIGPQAPPTESWQVHP